jgi:hypothetical protein
MGLVVIVAIRGLNGSLASRSDRTTYPEIGRIQAILYARSDKVFLNRIQMSFG